MNLDDFKKITFVKSASDENSLVKDTRKTELAFWGRSNVGKSSLLNALAYGQKLAKTSNTPGRTQLLNFFSLSSNAHLVDMPGYGFAKAPKSQRQKWESLIYAYLLKRPNLKRLFLLIDARHGIIKTDAEVIEFLNSLPIAFQVVLTKADKTSSTNLKKISEDTLTYLKNYGAAHPEIIITSAEKGLGMDNLRATILNVI